MKRVKQFVLAVAAGILIGVGGTVYLSLPENPLAGSFLFAIGLLSILNYQLNLFTGKVGYLPENRPSYLLDLLVIWVGNWVGAFLAGIAVRNTRVLANMSSLQKVVDTKLNDGLLSIFLLSIFCGLMMFLAVDVFKNTKNQVMAVAGVILPVMVFILSGFEHCVANMYYYSLASVWGNTDAWLSLLVMTLGNSLGGMLIPLMKKIHA